MLRRQQHIRTQVHKLIDAGLFALSLWAAHRLRSWSGLEILGGSRAIPPFDQYLWLFGIVFFLSPPVLESQGFYSKPFRAQSSQTLLPLFRGCMLITLSLVVLLFLVREQAHARSVIIFFPLISFGVVYAKESLILYWLRTTRGVSTFRKRLILAGTEEDVRNLRSEIQTKFSESAEVLTEVDLNRSSIAQLVELLHLHSANGVVIGAKNTYFGQIEKAIQACELEGVEVWLMADFFKTQFSRTSLDDFNGRPMLVFRSTPEVSWQAVAKHAIDLVGTIFLLLFFLPVLLLVAIAVKLGSSGPVFFKQQRSGLNGKPFTMLKFRTMVTNAEQLKAELMALNEMDGPVFKVTNDPRITPIGKFLRKYSLDEFPQLLNVLSGEMSLVGPRPLPVDEVQRFDDLAHRRRLSVKPGLTCLWQIKGRNEVRNFQEWVKLDLEYIDNWSFWLDIKILVKTVPVVLMGTGAR